MEKKKLIIGILAFVILIAGAALLYGSLSEDFTPDSIVEDDSQGQVSDSEQGGADQNDGSDEPSPEPQPAPDFTMEDGEGNAVALSDFFGKPIVLNFWASWCGPCKAEMPDFEEVYNERGEEIQFLMVNVTGGRETLESAKDFIADSGYTFPVYYDTATEGAMTYGAYSIPMTFFINSEGNLVAYVQGMTSASVLEQGIEMIME